MSTAEMYRRRMAYAAVAVGFGLTATMVMSLMGYGEDGGKTAANVLIGFGGTLVSVGVVFLIFDSPAIRLQREQEERERQELRDEEERKQERRNIAQLRQQLHSRVPGFAARASEELWRRGWFWKNELTEIDLNGADLSGAILAGAKMREAELYDADLSKADLRGMDLTEANLRRANLSGSDLTGADLTGAVLAKANLTNAFLDGVDLSDADLSGADLSGAHIKGATLGWGDPEEECYLDSTITYAPARFNERTLLPDGQLWTPETDMAQFTGAVSED